MEVILREPLANLCDRAAHYVVRCGVVVGNPLEDFDANRPFLQMIARSLQSGIDNELENGCVPFAVLKNRTGQNSSELAAYALSIKVRPETKCGVRSTHGPLRDLPIVSISCHFTAAKTRIVSPNY